MRLCALVLERQQTHGATPPKQTQRNEHATEGTIHFTHETREETGAGHNKERTFDPCAM